MSNVIKSLEAGAGTAKIAKGLLPSASKKTQDMMSKILFTIVIVIIVYILYQIYKGFEAIKDLPKDVYNLPSKIAEGIEQRISEQDFIISDKILQAQREYGISPYLNPDGTAKTLNEYAESQGLITDLSVKILEFVPLGSTVLEQAAIQGALYRDYLITSGNEPRYEALDPISKFFVTSGEAIVSTFTGISPTQAGETFKSWFTW